MSDRGPKTDIIRVIILALDLVLKCRSNINVYVVIPNYVLTKVSG